MLKKKKSFLLKKVYRLQLWLPLGSSSGSGFFSAPALALDSSRLQLWLWILLGSSSGFLSAPALALPSSQLLAAGLWVAWLFFHRILSLSNPICTKVNWTLLRNPFSKNYFFSHFLQTSYLQNALTSLFLNIFSHIKRSCVLLHTNFQKFSQKK